jgi:hypothetical protein
MRSIELTGWGDTGFFGLTAQTIGNPTRGRKTTAWVPRSIATTATKFNSNVCAGGGVALLIDGNNTLWISTNGGVTWTESAQTFLQPPFQINYAGGTFIVTTSAAAGAGSRSSNGGATWTALAVTHFRAGWPVGDGGGNWLLTDPIATLSWSSNAANGVGAWTQHAGAAGSFNISAIWDGTQFVATGISGGQSAIATAPNITGGWTFTPITGGPDTFVPTLVFQNARYTVPTTGGVRAAATPAGLATAADVNVGLTGLQCLLGGNSLLWAFDGAGHVVGSTDGFHWTKAALNFDSGDFPGQLFQAYDAVNHQFIAIGSQGLSISTHTDSEL